MTGSRICALRRAAAVVVGTLALLALSTSASADGSGGRHHGHHSVVQHFVLIQTDPEATAPDVVAFGPIHARGTDTVIDDNHDVFTFPAGSISVTHKAKHSSDSFDPVTCYGTFNESGKYWVTGGTGAYDDARGHGKYSVRGNFIGCSQDAPPEVFSLIIRASGPLHL
jgi:hypothetical protein